MVPHGAGHAIAFFIGLILIVAMQRMFRRKKMFNIIQYFGLLRRMREWVPFSFFIIRYRRVG